MRVRFVVHGQQPEYRYAEMDECPRRGEFITLDGDQAAGRYYVKWVRWEPFKEKRAMRMLDRPPTEDDLHFDVTVELEMGMPT